jgi:hypothetical protein
VPVPRPVFAPILLVLIVGKVIEVIGHIGIESVTGSPIAFDALSEPILILVHKGTHLILPILGEFHISPEAVGFIVVLPGRGHFRITNGKHEIRDTPTERLNPLLTDILLIVLIVEVKVVFSQLCVEALIRLIPPPNCAVFVLIVFKFLLDSPIGGVGVLEVTLVETGEKGKFDIHFHISII